MRLDSLSLENIGPFDRAEVEFITEGDTSPGVTLLTGMNGTGKTIILDAIRAFFGEGYGRVEREIWRPGEVFSATFRHSFGVTDSPPIIETRLSQPEGEFAFAPVQTNALLSGLASNLTRHGVFPPPWVVDFWRSQLRPRQPAHRVARRDRPSQPLTSGHISPRTLESSGDRRRGRRVESRESPTRRPHPRSPIGVAREVGGQSQAPGSA